MPSHEPVTIEEFESVFRNVRLPFGLSLDVVKVTGKQGSLERHPFGIRLNEPANVLVSVSEEGLRQFLDQESPGGLKDFEVKLDAGKLYVAATVRIVLEIRARAVCDVEIVDEKQLWVRLHEVEVLGVGARNLVEKQLEKINPVLDVAEFPFDIILQKVSLGDGDMVLRGTIKPEQ